MAKPRENPILVLGFFLSLALFAWLAVYAYNYFYVPKMEEAEARAAAEAEVARLHAAADSLSADPPVRVAYQPMPWPTLMPDNQRIELQAHIQPYDSEKADFLCERMPQVKDVINIVLSQFDEEKVAINLDLAVVEEQLTTAINQRLGEQVIRGTFIDVGTTSGEHERYRLYCRTSETATGGFGSSTSANSGSESGGSGGSGFLSGNGDLENWFVRAAKSRERRVQRLQRLQELEEQKAQ